MSEIATNEMASAESEKPVVSTDDVKLPPFPDPTDNDFDEDIPDEERAHYKSKFSDLNTIATVRLHCTACDRHLGCSATNESRMRPHPMLRTLICHTCHSFYNSGEFDKGEDGSELYCRWCGQGGQVYCCSDCIHVFCAKCIKRNLGLPKIKEIENTEDWKCFKCNPKCIWDLRAVCWALLRYCDLRNKLLFQTEDLDERQKIAKAIAFDATECCKNKARRSQKTDSAKKKEAENVAKKIISKMPPTIQVKKFASVNVDEFKPKIEKKPQKRPASPKNKAIMIKNPISIAPCPIGTPINKKFRDESSNILIEVNTKDNLEDSVIPRKLGRPLSSKNKSKVPVTLNFIGTEHQSNCRVSKNIGRPVGSKNKKKTLKFTVAKKHCASKIPRNNENAYQRVGSSNAFIEITTKNSLEQNQNSNRKGRTVERKRGRPKKPKPDSAPEEIGMLVKKRGRTKSDLTRKEQQRAAAARYRQKLKASKQMPSIRKQVTPTIEVEVMMTSPSLFSPIRYPAEKKINLTRIQRPRMIGNNSYNGFNNPGVYMNNINNMNMNAMNMNNLNINNMSSLNMNLVNDNINLSLDSLTQGLDFAAVQAMNNSNQPFENNDDVVCTPDFPLEPLCEVTEDHDDDVECITPGPVAAPKINNPPPLVPVRSVPLSSIPKGNVIQMTDSDVTVNALTGGLKFRVDPQTLSSNKMYRLPDGRIFAINANPNMPGGYSATIVSQNPDGTPKVTPRSETFAAKLSAVSHSSTPKAKRGGRSSGVTKQNNKNTSKSKSSKSKDSKETSRTTDLKVPVEWYRYNTIDAVDALEYSLSRLHKLKKETTSAHLRTRTVEEMKYLHRTLEQLLTTSSKRFIEIRDTLNKEMKSYLSNKQAKENSSEEEEDDDVEILPNTENDDPIFIDENSDNEGQEVDLTGAASSEHNDSTENRNDTDPPNPVDRTHEQNHLNDDSNSANVLLDFGATDAETSKNTGNGDSENAKEHLLGNQDDMDKMDSDETPETSINNEVGSEPKTKELNGDNSKTDGAKTDDDKTDDEELEKTEEKDKDKTDKNQLDVKDEVDTGKDDNQNTDEDEPTDSNEKDLTDEKADPDNDKDQDADMSDEMIDSLLKDDNLDENASMEISDLQEAEQILS